MKKKQAISLFLVILFLSCFLEMEELAPPQDVLEAGPELTAGGQDAQAISAQEDGVHEEPESAKNISYVPLSVHAALDFGFWTWWLHDP